MNKPLSTALLAILCFSTLSATAIVVQAQSADSWPMFHYDLAHTGTTTSAGPSSNQTLWKFTAGNNVWSSPAIADGIVYIASFDHNVYALDALTGAKTWNFSTGKQIYSSPAVADGVVYIGSNDKNVYALDAKNGALKWNYTTGDEVQASPTVYNDVVYVGSNDNNLYALRAADGTLVWKFPTGNDVISSAAIVNGSSTLVHMTRGSTPLMLPRGRRSGAIPQEAW